MKKPPSYICRDRGMTYFRKRGCRKVRIRERFGTPEFHRRYAELLEQDKRGELKPERAGEPKLNTWRWLCVRFFASETGLLQLDAETRHVRRRVLESTWDEPIAPGLSEMFADCPLDRMTGKAVRILRDRKRAYPEAANVRIKAIGRVFAWAIEEEIVTTNPARDVARLKSKRQGGHHSWTLDEVAQFETHHPLGTKAHLALSLLVYVGCRRGDVILLGRQHVRDGRLKYTQQKNRKHNPVTVDMPLLPALKDVIDASPVGDLTFLVNDYGRPLTNAVFGNTMRRWCREAGLPHCSAHGLRKAAAAIAAGNGATTQQLMAMFGWRSIKEAERYTKAAERARMADDAPRLLTRPKR